jgi:hypothetical protein
MGAPEMGIEQMVQVHTGKELATHAVPEPCMCNREVVDEASAGVQVGWVIEPRKVRGQRC